MVPWIIPQPRAQEPAYLVGPDGTLYAHATTTCLVFDIPAQSKA